MEFTVLDVIVASVMAIAVLRGAFVGMIREGFSIAAIGAAILAVRYGAGPSGAYIDELSGGEIGASAAKWVGGLTCGALGAVVVGGLGRWMRRGARVVGLGMFDRVGGAVVGATEGALVASLLIIGLSSAAGRTHPAIYEAYSVRVFDEMRYALQNGTAPNIPGLPSVASGPPESERR